MGYLLAGLLILFGVAGNDDIGLIATAFAFLGLWLMIKGVKQIEQEEFHD